MRHVWSSKVFLFIVPLLVVGMALVVLVYLDGGAQPRGMTGGSRVGAANEGGKAGRGTTHNAKGEYPAGGVKRPRYVFLYLSEFSSHGWNVPPLLDARQADVGAGFDSDSKRLFVPRESLSRKEGIKAVVYHESDVGGVSTQKRVWFVSSIPYRIPLKKAEGVPAMLFERGRFRESRLRNDGERLVAGDIDVLSVDERGSVRIRYGAKEMTLEPETGWGELRSSDGKTAVASCEAEWTTALERAFAEGMPFTRLLLYNYGWWNVHDMIPVGGGGQARP